MQGLEALLRVRKVEEDKALKILRFAKRDFDKIRIEEEGLSNNSEEVKETLTALEKGSFGIRESIIYRRYLNMIRGRLGRCRKRKLEVRKIVDEKVRQYEKVRHGREAIDDLIEKRKEEAEKERGEKEEKLLGDLGQQKWFRDKQTGGSLRK